MLRENREALIRYAAELEKERDSLLRERNMLAGENDRLSGLLQVRERAVRGRLASLVGQQFRVGSTVYTVTHCMLSDGPADGPPTIQTVTLLLDVVELGRVIEPYDPFAGIEEG